MSDKRVSCAIRRLEASDVGRVMQIASALEQAPHWPESTYMRMLDAGARPCRVALVADDLAGSTAGFVIAVMTPPEAELESIAVAPDVQRRGLATALWEAIKGELAAGGVTVVHLEVRAGNLPAQDLYRRLGFVAIGSRRGYYADPVEDAILYRIDLA